MYYLLNHHQFKGQESNNYFLTEIETIDSISKLIQKFYSCCSPNNRTGCDNCPSSIQIMNFFTSRGFNKIEIPSLSVTASPLLIESNISNYGTIIMTSESGQSININQALKDIFKSYDSLGLTTKGMITTNAFFCAGGIIDSYLDWLNSPEINDKVWIDGEIINGKKILFYKIIFNSLDANLIDNYALFDNAYIKPIGFTKPNFNADTVKKYVENIYSRNELSMNVSFTDKTPLEVNDLWIQVIYNQSPRYNTLGFSFFNSPPITVKYFDDGFSATYANFYIIEDQYNDSNYKLAYTIAHEFLHQMLIKSYYNIHITAYPNELSFPLLFKELLVHFNAQRPHLNADGKGPVPIILPVDEPSSLRDFEEILSKHRKVLACDFLVRKIWKNTFVRKIHAEAYLIEIKKEFSGF